MIGNSIGVQFRNYRGAGVPIDAQAQVHFNRVIADGGVVPSGLSGVNAFFSAVKAIYGTTDINTAISAAYDAHYLGYKLGAGSGTTLGQAAQTLYAPKGIFGGIGTGSAFWEGVGVSGNFLSTPNAAANQITGDIELTAQISPTALNVDQNLINKSGASGTSMAYNFFLNASGGLSFAFSPTGAVGSRTTVTSTATLASAGLSANTIFWVRVSRNATSGAVQFFTSTNGTTFTQLGTTISSITGNLFASTEPLNIGTWANALHFYTGRIYRATIANSIGGTPVVDFNANQYTGANTWTSTTSEVWTVNSTGAGLADVTQTTAASQPLLLAHTGENYWFGSGVTGNFCSAPAFSYPTNSGGTFIIKYTTNNNAQTASILAQDNSLGNRNWIIQLQTNRTIIFLYKLGLTASAQSTASLSTNFNGFLKVEATSSGADMLIKFYTSLDGETYTQLGTTITKSGDANTFSVSSSPLQVGANSTDGGNPFSGKIYSAQIYDGNGNLIKFFNPASYNPSVSQTQWSSATGEVWSLNVGTATTGYKAALVTKSIVQGDGVDDVMNSTLSGSGRFTQYLVVSPLGAITTNEAIAGPWNGANWRGAIYTNNSRFATYQGSGADGVYGSTITKARLIQTGVVNSSTGTDWIPFVNGADVSNGGLNIGTENIYTSVNILARSGGVTFSNSILSDYILTRQADNSTQRTAMYNALKSYNNGAF